MSVETARKRFGGSGVGTAEPIGAIVENLSAGDLAAQRSVEAARLRAWIVSTVSDPELNPAVATRWVNAIQSGQIKAVELGRILKNVVQRRRENALTKTAGAYFVGATKQRFKEKRLTWEE